MLLSVLILLAGSWLTFGKEAPSYWNVLSVADIGKDYGSDNVLADISPVTKFNKTQLELRHVTTTPWPGPFPAFFQFPSTERLNQAYVGYAEIFVLAQAALLGVCQRNRAFQRYFQESEAENVRKVFEKVLGDGYGPAEVADLTWPFSVGYLDRLSAGFDENLCVDVPSLAAALTNTSADGPGSVLFLCPNVFAMVPRKLTEISCNDIPASAGPEMATLGSFMLHQILHWNIITYKAARLFIVDYG